MQKISTIYAANEIVVARNDLDSPRFSSVDRYVGT